MYDYKQVDMEICSTSNEGYGQIGHTYIFSNKLDMVLLWAEIVKNLTLFLIKVC